MFGKIKDMAMKKLLEKQLKNVPEDQQAMIMSLMEKNPEVFKKIATEMQAEMKAGKNQMSAAMTVLPKYQKEIMEAMTPEMRQKLAHMQAGAMGKFNPNGSIRR